MTILCLGNLRDFYSAKFAYFKPGNESVVVGNLGIDIMLLPYQSSERIGICNIGTEA